MMETSTQLSFTDEGFADFLASRVEPQWLAASRRTEWET